MEGNAKGIDGSVRSGGSIEDAGRERPAERTAPANGNESPGPGSADEALATRVRRFYLINARGEYRFLAQPQRVAFREEGKRLETVHDDPAIIRGMLDVAQSKGWERVNLAGSETFRRIAWLEAGVRGVETLGYAPTPEDRQRLEEWRAERLGVEARRPGAPIAQAPIKVEAPERSDGAAQVERDAVILAVAEEVLRKRNVGEVTRARVAAAISRRLEQLREQGFNAPVRGQERAARSREKAPMEVPRGGGERSPDR
jgi:hypothetical protein